MKDYIRDLSERVYRDQLGPADAASMITKDKDDGQKLRARATSYDRLTRAYLRVLGIEPGENALKTAREIAQRHRLDDGELYRANDLVNDIARAIDAAALTATERGATDGRED